MGLALAAPNLEPARSDYAHQLRYRRYLDTIAVREGRSSSQEFFVQTADSLHACGEPVSRFNEGTASASAAQAEGRIRQQAAERLRQSLN